MSPNLFDLALKIRTCRYIIIGLTEIGKSNIFPVLPINLQQKVQRKLIEHSQEEQELVQQWPGDATLISHLIDYLGEDYPYPEGNEDIAFVTKTSRHIRLYVKQRADQMLETLQDPALVNTPPVKKRGPRRKNEST